MLARLVLALAATADGLSLPLHRRQACQTAAAALGGALLAGPTFTYPAQAEELGASVKLTIGQYLVDLREARRGLKLLVPLLESGSDDDCLQLRQELRKQPIFGIRKAATKVLAQLDEKSELRVVKEQQYQDIKKSLTLVDDACRERVDRSAMDTVGMLNTLGDQIQAFETGFGIGVQP